MTTLHVALGELTKIVLKVIIVCNIIFGVSNDENLLEVKDNGITPGPGFPSSHAMVFFFIFNDLS
jgi:hypothetical protein